MRDFVKWAFAVFFFHNILSRCQDVVCSIFLLGSAEWNDGHFSTTTTYLPIPQFDHERLINGGYSRVPKFIALKQMIPLECVNFMFCVNV